MKRAADKIETNKTFTTIQQDRTFTKIDISILAQQQLNMVCMKEAQLSAGCPHTNDIYLYNISKVIFWVES